MKDLVLHKIFRDIKKYRHYIVYSAKSSLKAEVASSRLSWLWWILDPLLYMLVYMFVSAVVFNKSEQYFPIFVFTGVTVWTFFNKSISQSVRTVKINSAVVSKVYLPKYLLLIQNLCVEGFKMCISFGIIAVLMIAYGVPLTMNIFFFFPLVLMLVVVVFAFCTIMLHFGVFIEDLANVITAVLRLIFYMSGIFYSLETRVPAPFNGILLNLNPAAFVIDGLRKALLYGKAPNVIILCLWLIAGVVISSAGICVIYKYENGYIKVS